MLMCCIIKPPMYGIRDAIKCDLIHAGIEIVSSKAFAYHARAVDVLYDHMDEAARLCITRKYGGRIGDALLIEAEDIEMCKEIIGTESDPCACQPHTLRARYGSRHAPERIGGWLWHENAVHRPVDERERIRDLALIFPEYKESTG